MVAGPFVYDNWHRWASGKEWSEAIEYPIFTDAPLRGQASFGPYAILYAGAFKTDASRPSAFVRCFLHISPDEAREEQLTGVREPGASAEGSYHGAGLAEEVCALLSLSMGIRMKAGGASRRFDPADLMGSPVGWEVKSDPVFLRADWGSILPVDRTGYSLADAQDIVDTVGRLTSSTASRLVRVARLFQDALWICEREPELAWLLLVSAVEAATDARELSGVGELGENPVETLRSGNKKLFTLLQREMSPDALRQVAEELVSSMRPTKKFLSFLMRFMPHPPRKRPPEWAQHAWSKSALRESLSTIYDHRSRALHGGKRFPAPMCEPPFQEKGWDAAAECKKFATSVQSGDTTWEADEYPMYLHTFAYIVQGALLGWWHSLAADSGQIA